MGDLPPRAVADRDSGLKAPEIAWRARPGGEEGRMAEGGTAAGQLLSQMNQDNLREKEGARSSRGRRYHCCCCRVAVGESVCKRNRYQAGVV